MGVASSRRRNRQQQQAAPAPYPPPTVYQHQPPANPFGPPDQYANNGQMYGGWRSQYPAYPGGAPPPGGPGPAPNRPPPPVQPSQAPQKLTQTATIRNAVNLKKHSMKLVPVPGSTIKFSVQFTFDASTPCRLTTFVMAKEEPSEGCSLTSMADTPPPAPEFYPAGLGHVYPTPGAPECRQTIIDMGQYDEKQLMAPSESTYPLVFRLETISEKGLADGHVLQELEMGQAQKVWVQSQTTFASLGKHEEGHHMCKVLKQKIWVEGVSYELQEIYGMEHASDGRPKTESEKQEESEERLCVICLCNDRDTTVLPCRHMCMCHDCAQELRKQSSKCPICRNHVESLLHIKMQQKPTKQQMNAALAAAGGDAAKLTDEMQKLQQQQQKTDTPADTLAAGSKV